MGVLIASIIISLWGVNLVYSLFNVDVSFSSPYFYLHILAQGYLYTGLFITAHDAMHGTISKNKKINYSIGWLCTFLFAGLSYSKLLENHKLHHNFPGESSDPDFNIKSQNFFVWFSVFMYRYVTLRQIIIMAIIFNLLKIQFAEISIWSFFVIPVVLGSLQLFFFGTYLPHRYPHSEEMNPYNARTLKKNHFLAMITCYFFGYHHEHHHQPYLPWWKLYTTK